MMPLATPTPDGRPGLQFDELLVTPGVIGFAVTALIGIAVIFLLLDLNRRIRRVSFRAEAKKAVQEELARQGANGPAVRSDDADVASASDAEAEAESTDSPTFPER